jgi:hypothetical protein
MKKLRLPKPAATNVVNRHLYIGSVYTNEQMHKFAEKAAIAEREACAKVCDDIDVEYKGEDVLATWCSRAIRARGNK